MESERQQPVERYGILTRRQRLHRAAVSATSFVVMAGLNHIDTIQDRTLKEHGSFHHLWDGSVPTSIGVVAVFAAEIATVTAGTEALVGVNMKDVFLGPIYVLQDFRDRIHELRDPTQGSE